MRSLGWDILVETTWLRSLGTWEASRRHPGAAIGTQRHQGSTQEARGSLEAKVFKRQVLFQQKSIHRPFLLERGDPSLTVCDSCPQELTYAHGLITPATPHPASKKKREKPSSLKTIWGIIWTGYHIEYYNLDELSQSMVSKHYIHVSTSYIVCSMRRKSVDYM